MQPASIPVDGLTGHTPNRDLPEAVPHYWRDIPSELAKKLGGEMPAHLWQQLAVAGATLAVIGAFFFMLYDLQFGTGVAAVDAPEFMVVDIVNIAPPQPVAAPEAPAVPVVEPEDDVTPQDETSVEAADPVEESEPEPDAEEDVQPPPEAPEADQPTLQPKPEPKPRIAKPPVRPKIAQPVRKVRAVAARLPERKVTRPVRQIRRGGEGARAAQRSSAPSRASSRGLTSPQAIQRYLGQVRSTVMRRVPRGLSGRFTVSLVIGAGGRLMGLSVSGSGTASDKARISGALRGSYPAPPSGVPVPFRVGVPVSFVSGSG